MATAFLPPCDETLGRTCREEAPRNARGVLAATVLGSSLAFVVGSIINVALPAIRADFAADAASTQWVVNAYLLPLGALVLLGGALGDHYGRRRVFLAGLALFTLACLACAAAPSLEALLAARVAQGAGAALLAPNSLSIIAATFSGEARGRAVGTWAAAGAIAGAGAPLLGGWIVDAASWRWAFLVVVPLALAALVFTLRSVTESREPAEEAAPLDWSGSALATLGLGAAIWAMIAGSARGIAAPDVLASLAVGLAALAGFLAVERAKGRAAMVPPDLFATSDFVGITVLTLLLYGALGGLIVLLPYMLIAVFGWSAAAAGAAILPFPLVIGTLSRVAGGLSVRVGLRATLTAGPAMVALGFALLAFLPAAGLDYGRDVLPGLLVMAVGMAVSVAPLTTAVMNSVDDAHTGTASGVNNATSRIAGLLATAAIGPILAVPEGAAELFVARFAVAAWIGAALAAASAAVAWTMISAGLAEAG